MKLLKRITIILFVLLAGLWLAASVWLSPFVKDAIETRVCKFPSDTAHIGQVQISYFPLGIKIKNAYFKLHIPKDSLSSELSGEVEIGNISGVHWLQGLKSKNWEIDNLEIERGSVVWNTEGAKQLKKSPAKKVKLPTVVISDVKIAEVALEIKSSTYKVSLNASMEIDKLSHSPKDRIPWESERLQIRSTQAKFSNRTKDINLAYRSLLYDSKEEVISITDLKMKPSEKAIDFVKKFEYRKAYVTVDASLLEIQGFDLASLHYGFFVDQVYVDSCEVEVFIDLRKELSPIKKPMPIDMIRDIEIPIEVKKIVLANSKLYYHHQAKETSRGHGKLYAENVNAEVRSISNIHKQGIADIEINVSGKLMNNAIAKIELNYLGGNKHNRFNSTLSLSAMPFADYNAILYPSLGVNIRSGYCSSFKVNMSGNAYEATGKLDIVYDHLKVAIPPNQEGEMNFIQKSVEAMGNFAVVNSKNKEGANNGHIRYQHNPYEPFIGYWWNSIQTGLIDAIILVKNNEFEHKVKEETHKIMEGTNHFFHHDKKKKKHKKK